MEIGKQFTIFDYINQITPVKLGKYNPNLKDRIGKMIPFARLSEFIGKDVIMELNSKFVSYKVVRITSFRKDSERIYNSPNGIVGEWLFDNVYSENNKNNCIYIGTADRIGYSDNEKGKENAWVSEYFCTNGRYIPTTSYTECMYEIN